MKEKMQKQVDATILTELDSLKRLFTLLLLKAGTSQGEIALALSVDQSVVSRMFSARKVKRFDREA